MRIDRFLNGGHKLGRGVLGLAGVDEELEDMNLRAKTQFVV